MRSAIILTDFAKDEGDDVGLLRLGGYPIINHIITRLRDIVDEIIIVTRTKIQLEKYESIVKDAVVILDSYESKSILTSVASGLSAAHGQLVTIVTNDTPFVSTDILSTFLDVCEGQDAVVARRPDGNVEPLQGAYLTNKAREAAWKAVEEGETSLNSLVLKLPRILYFSTLAIKELDPELRTYFTVAGPHDLKRAEILMRIGKER